MATASADLVGLAHKGRIAVGADADLTVLDTAAPLDVRAAALAHRHPISAYDGRRLAGSVTHPWLRGEEPTAGRLLTREAAA